MRIQCTNGTVLIDPADLPLVEGRTWRLTSGYARSGSGSQRTLVAMHRVIMGAPAGAVVDHINGDTTDNRRQNLRICSQKENARNRKAHGGRPFKGVYGRGERFRACIMIDGRQAALGCYPTAIEAALAYDNAARKHHGAFARLNFNPSRDWLFPYAAADSAGRVR